MGHLSGFMSIADRGLLRGDSSIEGVESEEKVDVDREEVGEKLSHLHKLCTEIMHSRWDLESFQPHFSHSSLQS